MKNEIKKPTFIQLLFEDIIGIIFLSILFYANIALILEARSAGSLFVLIVLAIIIFILLVLFLVGSIGEYIEQMKKHKESTEFKKMVVYDFIFPEESNNDNRFCDGCDSNW